MISYQHSRNERQWRATTGLTQKQFELLTAYFEEAYLFVNEHSINQIDNNLAMERILHTYADYLFFVLFQLKNALTYDSLGLLIQTDASNGQRIVERYLHLLELPLERKHIMPEKAPAKVIHQADAGHVGGSMPVVGLHQIRRNNSVDFDDVRYTVPHADVSPVIRIGARLWQQ